jgi:hypothetical protein
MYFTNKLFGLEAGENETFGLVIVQNGIATHIFAIICF